MKPINLSQLRQYNRMGSALFRNWGLSAVLYGFSACTFVVYLFDPAPIIRYIPFYGKQVLDKRVE